MDIEYILKNYDASQIKVMLTSKKRSFKKPLNVTEREYNPYTHNVMDPNIRKKKKIKTRTDKKDPITGEFLYKTKFVERCRTAIPAQNVLLERYVGFLFSNPVRYAIENGGNEKQVKLYNEVIEVFRKCKIKYFDKKLARTIGRQCECAELWYFTLDKNNKPDRIKVKLLSPLAGDMLYPHYNDYDDMDGFTRQYTTTDDNGNSLSHFDVYTDKYVYQYEDNGSGLILKNDKPLQHGFTKIPIIYYRREETVWNKVQPTIDRIELLLSNWGDTNDYFGSPSYFTKGTIKGFAEKGEQGKVYQGNGDADMKVLSWNSSPESVRTELATLFNIMFSYSQIPDISFETMKTLGSNTSGVAIELMFTDPHMKAETEIEMFGEMFTRRYNLVQNGIMTTQSVYPESILANFSVEPRFTPYIPKNDVETINLINASTGGKATMTQQDAVRINPLVDNKEETIKRLEEEQTQMAAQDIFNLSE